MLKVLVVFKDVVNNRQDVRLRGWTVQFPATLAVMIQHVLKTSEGQLQGAEGMTR